MEGVMHGVAGARVERLKLVVGFQHGVFHIITAPNVVVKEKWMQAAL